MSTIPNYSELTDEAVVAIAVKNIDIFEVIVERYESKLLRYIHRISAFSSEEAEEILQEVFIKAWKNLHGFSTKLKFSSWIYRIAHNTVIDAFRKSKSRGEDQQVELSEELFIPAKESFVTAFDAELSAANIAEVLRSIPEKYREVLVLHFLEDKDYLEICDILKCPKGTVAVRMSRAKEIFRKTAENLGIKFL